MMPLNPENIDSDDCYGLGCHRSAKMAAKMRTDIECRSILGNTRTIINDRRAKQQQLLEDSRQEVLLGQLLDENKMIYQLLISQREELALIKKKMGI